MQYVDIVLLPEFTARLGAAHLTVGTDCSNAAYRRLRVALRSSCCPSASMRTQAGGGSSAAGGVRRAELHHCRLALLAVVLQQERQHLQPRLRAVLVCRPVRRQRDVRVGSRDAPRLVVQLRGRLGGTSVLLAARWRPARSWAARWRGQRRASNHLNRRDGGF